MPLVGARKVLEISQSDNPKLAIIKAFGDLSNERVLSDLVLVGTYFRPEKTRGGIIRPGDNVKEDEFQGKVGLVLKKGPYAYGDWEDDHDRGKNCEVGDWVVYSIKDGWPVTINEAAARLIPYDKIRMNITSPEMAF